MNESQQEVQVETKKVFRDHDGKKKWRKKLNVDNDMDSSNQKSADSKIVLRVVFKYLIEKSVNFENLSLYLKLLRGAYLATVTA